MKKLICVCSPYGGKEENYQRALQYVAFVEKQGNIPIVSHVLLHGKLDDKNSKHRALGLQVGLLFVEAADELWVFGDNVSEGMNKEIRLAVKLGKKIRMIDISLSVYWQDWDFYFDWYVDKKIVELKLAN